MMIYQTKKYIITLFEEYEMKPTLSLPDLKFQQIHLVLSTCKNLPATHT